MKIGFIGLGIMGKPMAGHILQAGYELYVHNRSQPAVQDLVKRGAFSCRTPKEVAEQTDVIITMLPDSPDVEQVVLGSSGIIEGISPDQIVIDMSSINPLVAIKIAEQLERKEAHMLDAPVSGGEVGAIEGILAVMVGGKQHIFDQVQPILQTMGTTVTRVGDIGSGNTVKLINQIIVAINIAAVSEAFAFGKKAGVDLQKTYEAIKGGLAASRVLDTKADLIIQEQYNPGFRVNLHAKDLKNAVTMGEEQGSELIHTKHMLEHFNRLIEDGFGNEDHSALHRLLQ